MPDHEANDWTDYIVPVALLAMSAIVIAVIYGRQTVIEFEWW